MRTWADAHGMPPDGTDRPWPFASEQADVDALRRERGQPADRMIRPAEKHWPRYDVTGYAIRPHDPLSEDDDTRLRRQLGTENFTKPEPIHYAPPVAELLPDEPELPADDPDELLPPREMAKAVGIKTDTLRTVWEPREIMPPCSARRGQQRWYKRSYVEGIREIATEEGLLGGKQRKSINSTDFSARAWELYRELHPAATNE